MEEDWHKVTVILEMMDGSWHGVKVETDGAGTFRMGEDDTIDKAKIKRIAGNVPGWDFHPKDIGIGGRWEEYFARCLAVRGPWNNELERASD